MTLTNKNNSTDNVLYRYETNRYSDYSDELSLHTYKIVKETKCGYWIRLYDGFNDKRWVSKTTTKRFAHATKNEALVSFMYRKKRQIKILKARLADAEKSLAIANKEISNLNV
jgi:uncharacterized protein YwgA